MDIQDEIYQAIENIVSRCIAKQNLTQHVAGAVVRTPASENDKKYTVSVRGAEYKVKDGVNIQPSVGMAVWICVPNGNWGDAYICARK